MRTKTLGIVLAGLGGLSLACTGGGGSSRQVQDTAADTGAFVDADGDGYLVGEDCDDTDASRHPGMPEVCDDIDNDCDLLVDEEDDSLVDGRLGYPDSDGDGYGDPAFSLVSCTLEGLAENSLDCDDSNPDVYLGAPDVCGDGLDADCSGEDAVCPRTATLPVAPSADRFMWQGLQTDFLDAEGAPCTASLALSMGDQAMCYVDNTGELICAGRIYTETYGSTFQRTGLLDVEQVFVTPSIQISEGNTACALVGGVPTCLGYWNYSGQLGNGTTNSNTTWTPWAASLSDAAYLTTGTSDSYCALDGVGSVWCTGYGFGKTPTIVDSGSNQSLYINTSGSLQINDAAVWRVSQSRAECLIGGGGLECFSFFRDPQGRSGHVVDGGLISIAHAGLVEVSVWLEDDGRVYLAEYDLSKDRRIVTPILEDRPVLAIAYNFYTDSICGVYNDGSLVCWGSNTEGKLGTGSTAALTEETIVLPAGTFDLTCR